MDLNSSKRLELKERPDIGVYVNGLSSFVTKSVEEIEHLMVGFSIIFDLNDIGSKLNKAILSRSDMQIAL